MSLRTLYCLLLLCLFSDLSFAESHLAGKKVLYVASYENTYEWSAGIQQAIDEEFANTGVQLRYFYMDTKNHPAEAEKQAAAEALPAAGLARVEVSSWARAGHAGMGMQQAVPGNLL